jgi:manganese oxidase
VPLRRRIADENLLRYNGMLIGVFELLADARAQIASVNAAIEALRDFWVAQADLDMALIGNHPAWTPRPARRCRRRGRRRRALNARKRGPTMVSRRNFRRRRCRHRGGQRRGGQQGRAGRAARAGACRPGPTPCRRWCPSTGRPYNPVVTLNGWTLPWRMNAGVKEFHLVAEPVVREMTPGFKAHLWGYNGQSPGPTIEVVEGDRVRLFVTNKLGEHTSIHWHGQRLPNGMDGVTGLNQPGIPPGKTFVYEFVARRPGTFMYHPHADEMVQMAMGMMGFWVTHPKARHPLIDEVDRDFCFLLNAYDIDPGSDAEDHDHARLQPVELEQPHLPWHRQLNVRLGDKVRIRIGNLTMTNHPIHLHGHEFLVTGTDGGPTPRARASTR